MKIAGVKFPRRSAPEEEKVDSSDEARRFFHMSPQSILTSGVQYIVNVASRDGLLSAEIAARLTASEHQWENQEELGTVQIAFRNLEADRTDNLEYEKGTAEYLASKGAPSGMSGADYRWREVALLIFLNRFCDEVSESYEEAMYVPTERMARYVEQWCNSLGDSEVVENGDADGEDDSN